MMETAFVSNSTSKPDCEDEYAEGGSSTQKNTPPFKKYEHKWVYGGQDKAFFRAHNQQIRAHNGRMLYFVCTAGCTASGILFLYNLSRSSSIKTLPAIELLFFLLFGGTLLPYISKKSKGWIGSDTHFIVVCELSFLWLQFIGPSLNPLQSTRFLPLFFAAVPAAVIIPMHVSIALMAINLVVFCVFSKQLNGVAASMIDITSSLSFLGVGIALGQYVMKEWLSSFAEFDVLQEQKAKELAKASRLASIDPLTHVKNRVYYESVIQDLNHSISKEAANEFSIVLCDINGLKYTNDTYGHSAGDRLIQESCMAICHVFSHSPLYRIGGDEFALILTGHEYENRSALLTELAKVASGTPPAVSFAFGCADYRKGLDFSAKTVFERADRQMYLNKKEHGFSRDGTSSV